MIGLDIEQSAEPNRLLLHLRCQSSCRRGDNRRRRRAVGKQGQGFLLVPRRVERARQMRQCSHVELILLLGQPGHPPVGRLAKACQHPTDQSLRVDVRAILIDPFQPALQKLDEYGKIKLDEERKAAMVSNLLVVLCSHVDTQPVINTGTLYT